MKLFGKPFLVGIDLGSSSLKLVQFAKKEGRLILQRVEIREMTEKEGKPEALRELLHGVDLLRSQFFVAFNSPQTAVRVLTVPEMPPRELRQALSYQVKDYFPFPVDQALFDLEILGPAEEKGVRKSRAAVAASSPQPVDEAVSLLKRAGVTPSALLPFASALERLAARQEETKGLTRCLVDIGERYTELIIIRGKTLLFSRKVPVAGRDFTTALTGVLVSDRGRTGLSLEEAEQIKREVGIPAVQAEPGLINDKITTAQIASMLQSPLEQLVGEIGRCFDYYREETKDEKVDSLELYGRGASLRGLAHVLSEELEIEVKVGEPLAGLQVEMEAGTSWKNLAPFAGAMGAVLGGAGGINLLPEEIKAQTQRLVRRAAVQSLASATLLFLVFLYIGLRIQTGNYEKRIATAKLERSSLRLEMEKVSAQSVAHRMLSEEPYWEDVFKELSNVVPEETVLTEIAMKNKKIIIKGVLAGTQRETILSDFVHSLEAGIFKNVKLVTSRGRADQTTSEFELTMGVD